jgi:hypothetical protein
MDSGPQSCWMSWGYYPSGIQNPITPKKILAARCPTCGVRSRQEVRADHPHTSQPTLDRRGVLVTLVDFDLDRSR